MKDKDRLGAFLEGFMQVFLGITIGLAIIFFSWKQQQGVPLGTAVVRFLEAEVVAIVCGLIYGFFHMNSTQEE